MSTGGEQEPKSIEELEAELAELDKDIDTATAEAAAPDIFEHPDQLSYEQFMDEAEAKEKAKEQREAGDS